MSSTDLSFEDWLAQADLPDSRLTPDVRVLLHAAFRFQQQQGGDYYCRRLLSHLLLHCDCGLKIAQVARLTGFSRSTVSKQQGLSAKQLIQTVHHRLQGRPYGKLLPRHAGPVAQFLADNPQASHYDTLAFLGSTFGVDVSLQSLHGFLNTYGLDRATRRAHQGTSRTPTLAATTVPAMPADDEPLAALETAAEVPPAAGRDPPVELPPPSATLLLPATPPLTPAASQTVLLPPDCYLGTTQYAGAFLLLPQALGWLSIARDCLNDDYGALQRGLLSSVFCPLVGVERIFHLEHVNDCGFALLTGGLSCPSRHVVGGWRRHLKWYEVDAFCRRTAAWEWLDSSDALVSFDDHVVPRWTHKFNIPKGFVTTRNKYMRCEKLFYGYEAFYKRFVCVRAARGNVELRDVAIPLVQQVLRGGQPRSLHALFDAAAGKADADVRALWELTEQEPSLTVTLRACRYPHRAANWKRLPSGLFVCYEEPGPYVGASDKEIRLAETHTTLKDESDEQGVRTVIVREVVPGPKPDRWHPLYTTSSSEELGALEVLEEYRQRQHHEQGYRVAVHDLNLDAVPCGYDKESPDPGRPRWRRGPLQMMGWLAALVYNALADLTLDLPDDLANAHVRTLRLQLINRPGQLYVTDEALLVCFDWFRGQEILERVIDELNEKRVRLPWLGNRLLVLSLMPRPRSREGPSRLIHDI